MSDRDEIELHPAVGRLVITMRDEIRAHEATIAQLREDLEAARGCCDDALAAREAAITLADDAAHSVAVERERCLSLLRAALIPTQPGAHETNADRWWSQRIQDVLRAIKTGDENQTAAELIRHERERHAGILRERDATIARLTAAVEARDAAVREYLAAEVAINASCDARDAAQTTTDADAALSGMRERIDRYTAARKALAALVGGSL